MENNMELGTMIEVDLAEVRKFIQDEDFAHYLLEHTSDFSVAAYVLQALLDRVEADAQTLDNE